MRNADYCAEIIGMNEWQSGTEILAENLSSLLTTTDPT
jgi:hypothetical protein